MNTSRRDFIAKTTLVTAGISASLNSLANTDHRKATAGSTRITKAPGALTLNIFSKNLHCLHYSALASALAGVGFQGIDLTVRPDGHACPEPAGRRWPRGGDSI